MKRTRLQLEILEERDVPATFGYAWLDGEHLTLSFAADGTDIAGAGSDLSSVFAAAGADSQQDILRAFQTWAVYANLNFGIVADGGQAFGSGGAIQGDSRFGDIRIGARALDSGVLAITSPFNYFSSYSGNVVLNTQQDLGTVYDLYTAMLQESGHVLGIGNSANTTSVMFENYLGARTGLSAADIASVQALYGARLADAYEGAAGNNSRATATRYSEALDADLSFGDSDYFRFNTPLLLPNTTITLEAEGRSLLTARLTVFDSAGRVVATSSAQDALNNDLTLKLTNLKGNSTYYVRVDGATGDEFGVGAYRLSIQNSLLSTGTGTVNGVVGLLDSELGLNDTLQSATNLVARTVSLGLQTDFFVRSALSGQLDLDTYHVQAPQAAAGQPVVMVATVWSLGNPTLNPRLEVYNSAGARVAAEVLTNDNGTSTIQVTDAVAGADYFIKVSSATKQAGNYSLAVDFRADAIEFDLHARGSLGGNQTATQSRLTVLHGQMMHFVIAADALPSNPNATLTMTIRNAAGQIVCERTVKAGETSSIDVFLEMGTYSVTLTVAGTSADRMSFHLAGIGITDPVAASSSNPSSNPDESPPPSDSSTSDESYASAESSPSPPPEEDSSTWSYWYGSTPSDETAWY